MSQNSNVVYYCERCDVVAHSRKSFDQHLVSRKHQKRIGNPHQPKPRQSKGQFCSLCKFTASSREELLAHRRSEEHRDRLLERRAEATLRHLGPLFELAQLLLLHADPPIDLRDPTIHVGSLVKKLKLLGLGFACITCLKEFASANELRKYLRREKTHIYPLESIEREEEIVLQKLEERLHNEDINHEAVEKATLVFVVRKALLIKVFT